MVSVGNYDNFYLNYAVKLLDGEMHKLNSNFVFAYNSGDHFLVELPEHMKDGNQFLEKRYQLWSMNHKYSKLIYPCIERMDTSSFLV